MENTPSIIVICTLFGLIAGFDGVQAEKSANCIWMGAHNVKCTGKDSDRDDKSVRNLTFQDDFRTFQIWNGAKGWNVTGGPQWAGRTSAQGTEPFNYELGWYLDPGFRPATVNPFSIDDGVLTIKATPYEQITYFDKFPYTTGMINSYQAFSQLYGYFEMRARLRVGKGFLPAFWLLPTDGSHGEIDIMEILGSDPTTLYTTVHSFSTGSLVSTTKATTIPDATKKFHVYGVDWQADQITWYFDGQKLFQAPTPSDMHRWMYMIANVAVGGTWPGNPISGSTAEINIDYIRVYRARQDAIAFRGGD